MMRCDIKIKNKQKQKQKQINSEQLKKMFNLLLLLLFVGICASQPTRYSQPEPWRNEDEDFAPADADATLSDDTTYRTNEIDCELCRRRRRLSCLFAFVVATYDSSSWLSRVCVCFFFLFFVACLLLLRLRFMNQIPSSEST